MKIEKIRDFFGRSVPLPLKILLPATLLVGVLLSYGSYRYYLLSQDLARLETTSKELGIVIETLQANLASSTVQNRDLNDYLTILRARNIDFQNEVTEAKLKVSAFEKLNAIDPELLQKYSKVYFLNENYIPAELSLIDQAYVLSPTKPVQIHSKVQPYLHMLMNAARAGGIDITVLSGYRSFGTQANLKSQYRVVYGANTSNAFSAEQGYSEHQLGSTVDFTTRKLGETLRGFDATPAFLWLTENAHRFGFILSYPKGNTYYVYEPWHWRFVGVLLATHLKEQGKYFYDVSQRDLDPYLIKIFD